MSHVKLKPTIRQPMPWEQSKVWPMCNSRCYFRENGDGTFTNIPCEDCAKKYGIFDDYYEEYDREKK